MAKPTYLHQDVKKWIGIVWIPFRDYGWRKQHAKMILKLLFIIFENTESESDLCLSASYIVGHLVIINHCCV